MLDGCGGDAAADRQRAARRAQRVAHELVVAAVEPGREVDDEARHDVLDLVDDAVPVEDLELAELWPGVGHLEHDPAGRRGQLTGFAPALGDRDGDAGLAGRIAGGGRATARADDDGQGRHGDREEDGRDVETWTGWDLDLGSDVVGCVGMLGPVDLRRQVPLH